MQERAAIAQEFVTCFWSSGLIFDLSTKGYIFSQELFLP